MYHPSSAAVLPPAVPDAAEPEILHHSATTRVFRADGRVHKQPLGRGAAERVRQEREMLLRLAHIPGIARLAPGAAEADTLALEDAGIPLARTLAQGRIEPAALLKLAARLARILAEVHRAGVIHRNVTPDNVLCAADGTPTLIDFDLAVAASDVRPGFTHQNEVAGTLAYMAPEQTGRTGRALDHRADLYALGVVLYEMAVGRLPFESGDALELMHGHLVQVPVAPAERVPGLPRALSDVIMRLLEKEPGKRYHGADGLAHDLEHLHDAVLRHEDCALTLGAHDFGFRLIPPSQPLGREAEIAALRAVVASPDRMESCVLLAGPPGSGKTTLVNEVRPMVAARQGWFISVTFHQHRRDAFASAATMRALGRLLLAEPEERLAPLRERMLKALGPNLGLGATQLPEFELLLGKHPRPAVADPREAEARINQSSLDLLRSVASRERPVVMVLEDLQWAPSITLRFLDAVVTAPEPAPGLLVVGTYRTGDVEGAHPLYALFQRWTSVGAMPAQLEVKNLSQAALSALVAEMLREPPERTQALAEALYERTAGNPNDAVELLNALRQEGLLRHEEGTWRWSPGEVRAYVGDCSVQSLLARRIARLPEATQRLLQRIACLGGGVRPAVLQAACDADAEGVQEELAPAIEDGLVLAEHDTAPILRFRHSRVQQAVLDAMPPADRQRTQLAMARALVRHPELRAAAAEQYLPAVDLLTDPAERSRVATLFQDTAGFSDVLNYEVSDRLLAAAIALLGDAPDAGARLLQLEIARHQILYGMGRLEEGDAVYASFSARCDDPMELANAASVQMHALAARRRYGEAVDLGLCLLARLGLTRPADLRATVRAGLERVAAWNRGDEKLADFHRPPLADPHLLARATLMANTSASAYFCDVSMSAWLALEGHRMWTEQGPCAQLMPGACGATSLLVGVPQDHRAAYAATRHVLAVGDARGFEPGTSIGRFSFALRLAHWLEPIEDVVPTWRRAREDLIRAGDFRFAAYTYLASDLQFDFEPHLKQVADEVEAGLAFARSGGHTDYVQRYLPRRQLIHALRGDTRAPGDFSDAHFDEDAYVAGLADADTSRATYHMVRAISAALFGDVAAWARHSDAAIPMLVRTTGYYITANLRVLHAVSLAERARGLPAAQRDALVAKLDGGDLAWLRLRAADAPANYRHLLRWVEAERAWTTGSVWEAGAAFDAALAEAALHQRPWHLALITERAALFHLLHGMEASGRALLGQARDRYEAWGAAGKVRQMERSHAFLRARGAQPGAGGAGSTLSSDALDLLAVLRASQSLSSGTSVQQLRVRVAELLGAMTGASRVDLALWQEETGRWMLPCVDAAGKDVSVPVEEAGARSLLPLTAFRYAERTREVLLVEDARRDDRFADDPYVAALDRCSLLLVPILNQGTLRAMLVLENQLSAAAFSAERLDAVKLIAGQLAVSLEIALLYQELEQRVQERTRELRAAQAELVDTARRAGMAEIATNVLHNVGNVLNSVNVSATVVRTRMRNSCMRRLGRAAEMMQAHAGDLGDFLTRDEKGRLLPDYLGKLAGAADEEQREVMEELDHLTRSIEHIKEVVAVQQAHAGSSSVIEPADVRSLVEDALRINSLLLQRHEVAVTRDFGEVPLAQIDRTRVMQILVNLVRNAVQAMEARTEGRALDVRVEASGDGIAVRVKDQGEGIPPENLTRIFSHGFTTRKAGHGFGLHSAALAAREMGGALTASSEGAGHGATFVLQLPLVQASTTQRGAA